jgi:uncharacterized lipoprotein YmbA
MNRISTGLAAMTIGIAVLTIAGCASTKPTSFYTLSSMNSPQARQPGQDIAVGVGPVEIPDYLDRPHLVSRTSQNELRISDFNKWAGSFKEDISRVVAENFSVLLSTSRVYMIEWGQSTDVQYQVKIKLTRFEGTPGGSVMLKAHWFIYDGQNRELIMKNSSSYIEETDGKSYTALVAAQSRAIGDLSREIADALGSIIQK